MARRETIIKGDMHAFNESPTRGLGLYIAERTLRDRYVEAEIIYARGIDGLAAGDRVRVEMLALEGRMPMVDRVLGAMERL